VLNLITNASIYCETIFYSFKTLISQSVDYEKFTSE